MTFDDKKEELISKFTWVPIGEIEKAFFELKEEYAPTVEMTQAQKDLILRKQGEDVLYEIMGDGDGYYFNSWYWGDLKPSEVAQAYLHPETIKIKVVDE